MGVLSGFFMRRLNREFLRRDTSSSFALASILTISSVSGFPVSRPIQSDKLFVDFGARSIPAGRGPHRRRVGYQIMRFGSPDLEMARAIHALA
jgi:hypothetical protein